MAEKFEEPVLQPLLHRYLDFGRGVVDSDDSPLNSSPAAPAPSAAPARGGEEPKKNGLIYRLNEKVTELVDIIDNKLTGLKVLLAETTFLLDGRKKAMSVVLTLADAKPSLLFNTYEKVLQMKDKHVELFFSLATEFTGEKLALVKKWACSP